MKTMSFQDVQNGLLNRFLIVLAVIALPVFGVSVQRVSTMGWQPTFSVQVLSVCIALLLALMRHRLPKNMKAGVVMSVLAVLAIYALKTFALSAFGVELMMLCVLTAVVFVGQRVAIGFYVLGIIMLAVTGSLMVRGIIEPSVDVSGYYLEGSSWMSAVGVYSMLMGLGVLILGGIGFELKSRLEELNRANAELERALEENQNLKRFLPMCSGCIVSGMRRASGAASRAT